MTEARYLVCPGCGGARDTPRILRSVAWLDVTLCGHAFHRGADGYELTSSAERQRVDERRAEAPA